MAELVWNYRAFQEAMLEIDESLLHGLIPEVADLARSIAPVRRGPRGGKLKASVVEVYGEDAIGRYGDVHALWYGRFMDPKARQLHYLRPFLPTALFTVVNGRTFR